MPVSNTLVQNTFLMAAYWPSRVWGAVCCIIIFSNYINKATIISYTMALISYTMALYPVPWRYILYMALYPIPWHYIPYHGPYHGIISHTMALYTIPWHYILYHGNIYYTMALYPIPYHTVALYPIPWSHTMALYPIILACRKSRTESIPDPAGSVCA